MIAVPLDAIARRSGLVPAVRGAAAALALAATAVQLVDFAVAGRVAPALDLDRHASVFGIVSLLALGAAAAVAGAIAVVAPGRRRAFGVLAALLVGLLALRVAQPPHVLYLSAPLVAVTFVALWRSAPKVEARQLLRDACIVLAVAFAAHAIDEWLLTGDSCACNPARWEYHIMSVVKHVTELAGWILVAGGLVPAARAARR